MNIPGFTGEVSIYQANHRYTLNTRFAQGAENTGVIPQRMKLKTVSCDCDAQTDICVCEDGSVFDDALGNLDFIW